jgi:hypothetical protein
VSNLPHNAPADHASLAAADHSGRVFAIHIGAVELKYDVSPVLAGRILSDAGFAPPEDYVLEMLRGRQGPAEREFSSAEDVPLDDPHARHFRAVPRGGGRA